MDNKFLKSSIDLRIGDKREFHFFKGEDGTVQPFTDLEVRANTNWFEKKKIIN